jgi:hypothetical protein
MDAKLYRLFDVQTFNGQKIAIYVCEGNFPDAKILLDSQEMVEGRKKRPEVVRDSFYDMKSNLVDGKKNRQILTHYNSILKRSQRIIDENNNVHNAIFVNSTYGRDWRGEQTLYENKHFDAMKSDMPELTGCTPIGTIIL